MTQSWKRKFFAVASGQTVSLIGSSAVQFALIWWLTIETGSAVILGLAAVIDSIENISAFFPTFPSVPLR